MADDQNDNNSFFEEDDFLAAEREEAGDDAAGEGKANFKEIWAQNPSLKIFAVVAGVAILLISFMVFGGDSDKNQEQSVVRPTAEVNQPAGTAELPPAYEDAVRKASEQRAEEATESGGSSLPTPIARPSERIEAPVQVTESDPLSEWRKEAETRRAERQEEEVKAAPSLPDLPPPSAPAGSPVANMQQQQQQEPANPPLPTAPTPEMVSGMSQQLQQQMATIMETQIPREAIVVSMNIQPGYEMNKYFPPAGQTTTNANGQTVDANGQPVANAPTSLQATPPKPIIQAGTIAYAQVLTEANSDVPGPVLAEIASGPLTGGRAIGQFQVAQRHLVLQFNRVVKDGNEYQTVAYALDPETTLPGIATDIDNHYFTRVFLPAAAKFIQGFAQAATQTDTNAVVSNGTVVATTGNDLNTRQELLQGANEGAQELSQIFEQNAQRPRTIKVAAGTRIGLLFVNAVTDPTGQLQQNQGYPQQNGYQTQAQNLGQQFFNVTPAGQAYNAYNAYTNGNNNGYNNSYGNTYGNNYQQQSIQNSSTGQRFNYMQTPTFNTGSTIPR